MRLYGVVVLTTHPAGDFHRHTSVVNGIAVSPDGATLAPAGHDPAIMLWDVARRTRWLA